MCTVVHKGLNGRHVLASDQAVRGTGHASLVNSLTQGLTYGTGAAFVSNTGLVRNITIGKWRSEPCLPLSPTQVTLDHVMHVKPASTPITT